MGSRSAPGRRRGRVAFSGNSAGTWRPDATEEGGTTAKGAAASPPASTAADGSVARARAPSGGTVLWNPRGPRSLSEVLFLLF